MRISTPQLNRLALNSILDQQARLTRAQQEVSSGKALVNASDDSVAAVRNLNLQRNLEQLKQFDRNGLLVEGRLSLTEGVVTGSINILQRLRELTVQANSGALSDTERNALRIETDQQLQALLLRANTRDSDGAYVFAGKDENVRPYDTTPVPIDPADPAAGNQPLSYAYAASREVRDIQIGTSQFVQDAVTGDRVYGEGAGSVFRLVERLSGLLATPGGDPQGLTDMIGELDQAIERMSVARTEIGIVRNTVVTQEDLNGGLTLKIEEALASTDGVDFTAAISRFNQQLLGLQAAQQTFSQLQGLSLFNFIR